MKKVLSLVVALVLCVSVACTVCAAGFVPSISYKGELGVVSIQDQEGNEYIASIGTDEEQVIEYVEDACLVIVTIAEVLGGDSDVPALVAENLIDVYNALVDGTMEVPYDKLGEGVNADNTVIRELLDIYWDCEDHPEIVDPNGTTVTLTFDLGVAADEEVYIMTYKNNEWNPIVEVVNNGDGTVDATFENFCPVLIAVSNADIAINDPVEAAVEEHE